MSRKKYGRWIKLILLTQGILYVLFANIPDLLIDEPILRVILYNLYILLFPIVVLLLDKLIKHED